MSEVQGLQRRALRDLSGCWLYHKALRTLLTLDFGLWTLDSFDGNSNAKDRVLARVARREFVQRRNHCFSRHPGEQNGVAALHLRSEVESRRRSEAAEIIVV